MQSEITSTAERIIAAREQAEKDNIVKQDEINTWKEALNRIAETPEGELLFCKMVKFMALFKDLRGINPQTTCEINGMRAFYLNFIRPHLEQHNIQKVEK